jgi:hypothetical protein
MSETKGMRTMKNKAALIGAHFNDIVEGIHQHLKTKGIDGVRVSAIHFAPADAQPCGPGMVWKCVEDPATNGVRCGCFPA